MIVWIVFKCMILAVFGYTIFLFLNRFLESKSAPWTAAVSIIFYEIGIDYFLLSRLLHLNYFPTVFISQFGLTVLILILFQGRIIKKLALCTVCYTLHELTAYAIVPLLTRAADLAAFYIFHKELPISIYYMIWPSGYLVCAFLLCLLSKKCLLLRENLPDKITLQLFLPSAFIVLVLEFTAYICNQSGIFYYTYYQNKTGVMPVIYQVLDVFILFFLSLFGLIANLILVFGANHTMLLLLSEQQLTLKLNHYKAIMDKNKELQKVRHDMKNHVISLMGMLSENQTDAARAYLNRFWDTCDLSPRQIMTGNLVVDSILNAKCMEAKQNNIDISIDVKIPKLTVMEDFDLCILFGNAMDNAIEACMEIKEEELKKWIEVQSGIAKSFLILEFKNVAAADQYRKQDLKTGKMIFKTNKPDPARHGIGLISIKSTVEKYQGTMDIQIKNSIFCLTIMLPV